MLENKNKHNRARIVKSFVKKIKMTTTNFINLY